jgi:ribosome-associated heat shock protein Hsp15
VSANRQRIDRWLWNARIVRTRGAAASLAIAGHVRVNGVRVIAPGRDVKSGDVVTVALDRGIRVLKVSGMALRRGNAAAALRLYEDLTRSYDGGPLQPETESIGAENN